MAKDIIQLIFKNKNFQTLQINNGNVNDFDLSYLINDNLKILNLSKNKINGLNFNMNNLSKLNLGKKNIIR